MHFDAEINKSFPIMYPLQSIITLRMQVPWSCYALWRRDFSLDKFHHNHPWPLTMRILTLVQRSVRDFLVRTSTK